jgi:hypothetical protein
LHIDILLKGRNNSRGLWRFQTLQNIAHHLRPLCCPYDATGVLRAPVEVSFIATSLDDPSQQVQIHIF